MVNRITIAVDSVWPSPGGGAIVSGVSGGKRFKVVAAYSVVDEPPIRGEIWAFEGDFETHPKYGSQLVATSASPELPQGRVIVDCLVRHPSMKGVGPKAAERLWEAHGESLYKLLDSGDRKVLGEILGTDRAGAVCRAWEEISGEIEARVFLARYELPWRVVRAAASFWGRDTVQRLTEQPYRLLAFVSTKPSSWKLVDKVARSLGVQEFDDRRMEGAVEHVLYAAIERGDTSRRRETLLTDLRTRIGAKAAKRALELSKQMARIAVIGDQYQTVGLRLLESSVERRLLCAQAGQQALFDISFDPSVLRQFEDAEGVELTHEQRDAVRVCMENPVAIICGGAGVGKTTVLKAVNYCLQIANQGIVQMALAGRAARRMSESTDLPALTIAGAINRAKEDGAKIFEGAPVVVIDESSMVDLLQLSRLFRYVPSESRIILVGDPMQLPPIGAGLIFHRIVEKGGVPVAQLTKIQRASESSGIPVASRSLREGVWSKFGEYSGSGVGVTFVPSGPLTIRDEIARIADELAADSPDTQVLSAVRSGPAGTGQINQVLQERYTDGCERVDGWHFKVGDKVMFTKNDYEREIFNGSLGFICAVADSGIEVEFDTGTVELAVTDLEHLELAYAVTVHKSQGSEFKRVIVPLLGSRNLDRSLVYTAITRAKEQVVIVGDEAAIRSAVEAPPAAFTRSVGFMSEVLH